MYQKYFTIGINKNYVKNTGKPCFFVMNPVAWDGSNLQVFEVISGKSFLDASQTTGFYKSQMVTLF